jgi:hypothetical protein
MSAQIASMIAKAIGRGFTAKTILGYVSQQFPQYANKISHAMTLGYAADKILKHLVDPKGKNPDGDEYLTDSEKTDKNDKAMKRKAAIGAGAAGLGILGGGAALALRGGTAAAQALNAVGTAANAIPQNPPIPPTPPQPQAPINPGAGIAQQVQQQAQSPVIQAKQPASMGDMVQASQAIPDQAQQMPIFEQLLGGIDPNTLDPEKQQQLKFLSLISDQLQSKGKGINDPEFKNLAKRVRDTLGGKPGMMIEENARFNAAQEAKQANVKPLDMQEMQEPTSITEPAKITKPQEIKKGESVVTEDGNIAEIKGVSGNNFLIEENGKVRQVPMDSLRSEPEAIKKAKIVFDPSKVPEADRSAALAISLPMPDRSAIVNMFHDGSFYIYRRKDGQPIDESIIRRIVDGQDIPMTTGESFMGAWNQDTGDSRGSASFKELTAMAQDASKPDDPSKPLVFEKITNGYTHGYLKEFMKSLKEANRNFSAKPKKQKK